MNLLPSNPQENVAAYGFTMTAGSLVVRLGHRLQHNGVLLFATTQVGDAAPQMWRNFMVTRESAVEQAIALASDAEDYLLSTGGLVRPVEDLNFDDFIEHVGLTVNGEMN